MAVPKPEPRGYPGNLGLMLAEHAASNRIAVTDLRDPERPRPISFRELDAACDACARGLVRAGLGSGDRVGILSVNRIDFVIVLLGAMRAGVVPVPINVKVSAGTVSYVLLDSGARLVFAERETRHLVPAGIRIVEFGGIGSDGFEAFLDPGSFHVFEPNPESVAIQCYTSGSTGRPKGVLLTHYGQNWSRRVLAHTRGTTERDVILVAAPL
jgi:long-subunit acyl-CoA synthetase (AMP-forming)